MIASLEAKLAVKEKENDKILYELKIRKGEVQELNNKLLVKERAEQELLNELEKKKSEVELMKESINSLQSKVQEMEKELDESKSECRELREVQEKTLREKEELEDNIKVEAEKRETEENESSETISNLENKLQETTKELNELRYKCEKLDYLEEANIKLKESLAKLAEEYSRDLPEIFKNFNILTKTMVDESTSNVTKATVKEFGSIENLIQESKENLPAIAHNSIKILMNMIKERDSFRESKSNQSSVKKSQQWRSSNKKSIHGVQEENKSKGKHGEYSKASGEKYKDSLEENKEKRTEEKYTRTDEKYREYRGSKSTGGKMTDAVLSKSPLRRNNDSEVILRKPHNKGGHEDIKDALELPENYSVIQVYNNYTRKSGDYFDPYLQYGGESM